MLSYFFSNPSNESPKEEIVEEIVAVELCKFEIDNTCIQIPIPLNEIHNHRFIKESEPVNVIIKNNIVNRKPPKLSISIPSTPIPVKNTLIDKNPTKDAAKLIHNLYGGGIYENRSKIPNSKETGYLELIFGPMFSVKTTALIQFYQSLPSKDIRPFVINHSEDTRYSEKYLVSHNKVKAPCTFTHTLGHVWNNPNHSKYVEIHVADLILINEAQFFKDIFDVVVDMVERENKHVYLYGLDGDYERDPFIPEMTFFKGGWLDLIPYSDKVTKLSAKCKYCSRRAIFSHRLTNETAQVVIGSTNYIPLCRKCYLGQNH
jgi:thymidine kinase